MAGGQKEYSGGALQLTLASALSATGLVITVAGDLTSWPTGSSAPFVIDVDYDTAASEKILVQSRTGTVLTVASLGNRGYDNTTGMSHVIGAKVRHVLDAGTVTEANLHVNDDGRDDHFQYLNNARHDAPARHTAGTVIPVAAPVASAPGDSVSTGVSASLARADHRHAREAFGTAGSVSASAEGDTASAGVSTSVARVDHRHAREDFGLVGTISTSNVGNTASAGTALTPARSDHRHPREASGAPIASAPGDAIDAGSGTAVSLANHKHGREYYPNLTPRLSQDFSDQSVAISGNDIIMTDTFTVGTGGRLVMVSFTCQNRRNSGAGLNFAGNLILQVDGITVGAPDRLSSQTKDVILKGSLFVATTMTAGSHTVTIKGSCDPSSDVGMFYFNRAMSINLIGG